MSSEYDEYLTAFSAAVCNRCHAPMVGMNTRALAAIALGHADGTCLRIESDPASTPGCTRDLDHNEVTVPRPWTGVKALIDRLVADS